MLQKVSPPYHYLNIATGDSYWGIRSHVDSSGSSIHSASAGTNDPTSPLASVNQHRGWDSWRFYQNKKWHNGEVNVSCTQGTMHGEKLPPHVSLKELEYYS